MNKKKKATIKDIANVLGITPSAVSKALNDHPRIIKKTKLAVKQIAENLNYQPNLKFQKFWEVTSVLEKGQISSVFKNPVACAVLTIYISLIL